MAKSEFLKTIIIINPKAGKRIFLQLFLPQVLHVFKKKGIEAQVVYTRYQGHASKLVQRFGRSVDFITVFGGDGTIREVLQGMENTMIPLGIIPFGTVNVLALDLGIPFNPLLAANVIAEGRKKLIDVGRINGKPFILMVSTGIDAFAVHNLDLRLKRVLGKVAYGLTALWSAITYKVRKVNIYLPRERISDSGYMAVVSNSRFYGGRLNLDEDTRIDDGLLNVILFKKPSVLEIFRIFIELLSRQRKKLPDVVIYETSEVCLTAKKGLYMQTDGDKESFTRAHITIQKRVFPVFIP